MYPNIIHMRKSHCLSLCQIMSMPSFLLMIIVAIMRQNIVNGNVGMIVDMIMETIVDVNVNTIMETIMDTIMDGGGGTVGGTVDGTPGGKTVTGNVRNGG